MRYLCHFHSCNEILDCWMRLLRQAKSKTWLPSGYSKALLIFVYGISPLQKKQRKKRKGTFYVVLSSGLECSLSYRKRRRSPFVSGKAIRARVWKKTIADGKPWSQPIMAKPDSNWARQIVPTLTNSGGRLIINLKNLVLVSYRDKFFSVWGTRCVGRLMES